MANTISGKVIAISQVQSVPSKDTSKQPVQKRVKKQDATPASDLPFDKPNNNDQIF